MTTKRNASEPELFAPLHVAVVESPIGKLWVESDGQLITRLSFEALHVRQAKVPPVLQEAQHQLDAYFRKERKTFKLPLQRKGTRFQQLVWSELDGIRFGRSRTYAEIAKQIGGKAIARTVGNACGRNPFNDIGNRSAAATSTSHQNSSYCWQQQELQCLLKHK